MNETTIGFEDVNRPLSIEQIKSILSQGFSKADLHQKRILVLTPDTTRTCPLPIMIRALADTVAPNASQLDFMVALGTHTPMSEKSILKLYGLTRQEKAELLPHSKFLNHRWDLPDTLEKIGRISSGKVEEISNGLFHQGVDIYINRHVFDYDTIFILGPVFPHEVAGFSGGNKYLFPGISGGEFLHFSHWLGAVITSWNTIGIPDTPVRRAIDCAAAFLKIPRFYLSMVIGPSKSLNGLYIGQTAESWQAATRLSSRLNVIYKDQPFTTVIGRCPEMYDELWTAGKVMYKLEPIVRSGGRLIIYGPHLKEISSTWGTYIEKAGYHVRDYFLSQMDRFKDIPSAVLAHSTHVKGLGSFTDGREKPRIEVILATRIPEAICRQINLGYMDPDTISLDDYKGKEDAGVLFVDNAGEILHRLKFHEGSS
jgi:nickel-dependent lactate racemase